MNLAKGCKFRENILSQLNSLLGDNPPPPIFVPTRFVMLRMNPAFTAKCCNFIAFHSKVLELITKCCNSLKSAAIR